MTLSDLGIVAVWSGLGGGPLRGKRGQAFWRKGDGYTVALDAKKGTWFDYRDGKGGGVLALVETARGCPRSGALRWLEENCGLDARRSFSRDERALHAKRIAERPQIESWSIAARALAEQTLDDLEAEDSSRAAYTRLLDIIRARGPALIKEFRAWGESNPELAHAMVRAGMSSEARVQRRLALYLQELANAA